MRAEIQRREREGPHRFTLIVPATPPQDHMLWTDDEAFDVAAKRLEHALLLFREDEVEIVGRVGDASPVLAIADAVLVEDYDEIILSTLPPGMSRWLKRDVPDRVRRRFDLPLTVIVAEAAPVAI